VPFLLASHPLSSSDAADLSHSMLSDWVSWIGTTILIPKVKHLLKGYQGLIKNILCGQETLSGLQVEVQLSHLDPTAPFKTMVFDYDDVVEAVYMQLHINECFKLIM
jgi:hypothetical protein